MVTAYNYEVLWGRREGKVIVFYLLVVAFLFVCLLCVWEEEYYVAICCWVEAWSILNFLNFM